MFSRLRVYLRPPIFEDPRQQYAATLLHYLLLLGSALTLILGAAALYLHLPHEVFIARITTLTFVALASSFVLLHQRHITAAAIVGVAIDLIAFGTGGILRGITSPDITGLLVTVVFASVLLNSTATLVTGGISLLYIWILAFLPTGRIEPEALPYLLLYTPVFLMGTLSLALHRRRLDSALIQVWERERILRQRNTELDHLKSSLESQVQERTFQLERQAALMNLVLETSRQLTQAESTEELLEAAATLIHRQFHYYHVGIYLQDASGEYVVLAGTNSEGGRRLMESGHRLKIGSEGIIGAVAASQKARIAMDTSTDPLYLSHPELARTRSEAAFPLVRSERLLGVLDIESDQPGAFDASMVPILQHLADQIAVALENTRLHAEGQRALRRAERAYAEISARSWREYVQSVPWRGFRTALGEVTPLGEKDSKDTSPKVRRVLRSGQVYTEGDTAILPIQVRQQTIATLRLQKASRTVWGEEELDLMQAVSDQVAEALENARLYGEAQKRAAREELLSASTARMRSTLDLETILQTAVRELRSALGLSEAEIRLGAPSSPAEGNDTTSPDR